MKIIKTRLAMGVLPSITFLCILFIPGIVFVSFGLAFWMGLLVGFPLMIISYVIYLWSKKQESKGDNS